MKNTLEVVFNFLFYLAFVRLFFCTGTERLNKKFITVHVIFSATIEKLGRPLEACQLQSKGENSSSITIFKKNFKNIYIHIKYEIV